MYVLLRLDPTLIQNLGVQFVRLYFEATGTPYVDTALTQGQSAVKPYLEGSFPGAGQWTKRRASPAILGLRMQGLCNL